MRGYDLVVKTPDRLSLVSRLWPTIVDTDDILDQVNALPGLPATKDNIQRWMVKVGIKRNPEALLEARRRSALGGREVSSYHRRLALDLQMEAGEWNDIGLASRILASREWPLNAVKLLIVDRRNGKTTREIAEITGHTQAAVVAKTSRLIELGLVESRATPKRTEPKTKPEKPKDRPLERLRYASVHQFRGLSIGDVKGAVEHRIGMCRWALTCDEPSTHGNWCESHAAMLRRKAA